MKQSARREACCLDKKEEYPIRPLLKSTSIPWGGNLFEIGFVLSSVYRKFTDL